MGAQKGGIWDYGGLYPELYGRILLIHRSLNLLTLGFIHQINAVRAIPFFWLRLSSLWQHSDTVLDALRIHPVFSMFFSGSLSSISHLSTSTRLQ